jgi:hypothetical protein
MKPGKERKMVIWLNPGEEEEDGYMAGIQVRRRKMVTWLKPGEEE